MPQFTYQARDASGRTQQGRMEAASPAALVSDLRTRGWLVLGVRAVTSERQGQTFNLAQLNPFYWMPPRSLDVETSLQQMAVMLRSGLSLMTALKTVAEQASRPALARVWEQVARRIQEGSGLADAMAQHRCFNYLVVQLIRVGEQTGNLELVLLRAADVLERRRNLVNSLIMALAYPLVVLVAALGVSAFMVFNVIPKLANFLATTGRQLPAMTQFLVDVTTFIQTYLPQVLIGIVVAIVAGVALYLWPPGRMFIDRWLLRVPIIGKVLRLAGTALFSRGLGILVHSGVTLLEGLRTVERLFGNRYLALRVAEAREAVIRGGNLADNLTDRTAFMPMLSRMVAIGESAGTLEEVLEENATFHEAQLQRTIRWLSMMIEPAIIIVVGGVVGFVYISFFMALFAAAGPG
ncbi:MAG: type II secretion system F family protein [Gemmataceae bacterium]